MGAKQLRTLGLPSFKRRRLRGNLIVLCSFLRRGVERELLMSLGSSDRTHGNSLKINLGRFGLNIRKHFFTKRASRRWNRHLREVDDALCLPVLLKETFGQCL